MRSLWVLAVIGVVALGPSPPRAQGVVRSARITFVELALKTAPIEMEGIEVTAGFFRKEEEEAASQTGYSTEEIRRAPGSAGDVSRIFMTLPSVAKVSDQSNGLAVRGGVPLRLLLQSPGACVHGAGPGPGRGAPPYELPEKWAFSLQWIYAGGAPYTPLDVEASVATGGTVLDESRVNADRYPACHSLNLRFKRRFYFCGSDLVWCVSVWNAHNRKDVASYTWKAIKEEIQTANQWGLLPIFGLEWEF